MLFQPSNISPDEVNSTGCIDTADGLEVSWQVNGDSAMTAYQIDISANDAYSTLKYSTGKQELDAPFWGTNFRGETQYFRANITAETLASSGIKNGREYKFLITQWWGIESIQQTTASVFITRAAPTITISTIPAPVESKACTFTAAYSQAQGDSLNWVQWQIAEKGKADAPFFNTGKITGTGELKAEYDGFFTNTNYIIKCDIETSNGIEATTGWVEFRVEYTVTPPTGQVRACQLRYDSAVYVEWDRMEIALGYSVLRRKEGENVLHKIAEVDGTTGQIRDYSAASGNKYIYYIFPSGQAAYLTEPMVSEPVQVQFWFWSILEAKQNEDGTYTALASYLFRMGSGGVSEGEFSNNNNPQLLKNFTPYPIRQGESANYLTGSVSGYIGAVSQSMSEYSDSISQSQKLMQLSVSPNTLFLLDPKGHFLRIHTSAPITLNVNTRSVVMPQTMTIKWVETGDAKGLSLYSAPGGDFYPTDAIISTRFKLNPHTGSLEWIIPPDYDNGSIMRLTDSGELIQKADGAFTPAVMTIDRDTMEVTAEVT